MRHLILALYLLSVNAQKASRASQPSIPDYVLTYGMVNLPSIVTHLLITDEAPLVYLDQNELYLPSDIQSQINNTTPTINYTSIDPSTIPSPLTLSNLNALNKLANCTSFASCPIYLTSSTNINTNPSWLYGVLPDPTTRQTVGAKTCAVIVYDHENDTGTVDAFYMYFYAFNRGLEVLGEVLGNHVGDWEHSMVRFVNGTPVAVWLSQHDYGQAFSYSSLSKLNSRPLIYSALGSHASFAVPGTHSRVIAGITINDTTSPGPLWDPILSAYFYTYSGTPSDLLPFTSATAANINNTTPAPSSWLSYYGRWGDKRYLDADPRQLNLANLNVTWKYEDGPTGPADKGLVRRETCPDVQGRTCVTSATLPNIIGSSVPATVVRSSMSASGTLAGTTSSAVSSATVSATGKSGAGARCSCRIGFLSLCLSAVTILIYLA